MDKPMGTANWQLDKQTFHWRGYREKYYRRECHRLEPVV